MNPMFVPTVVFYNPEKNRYAQLIGKFDEETIRNHEQKFLKGQLPTFDVTVKAKEITIEELKCLELQI